MRKESKSLNGKVTHLYVWMNNKEFYCNRRKSSTISEYKVPGQNKLLSIEFIDYFEETEWTSPIIIPLKNFSYKLSICVDLK